MTDMSSRPIMPPTLMAYRFLEAVCRPAARQCGSREVVLPSGRVDSNELKKVVLALAIARAEQH
jgi:hypothetical protein